jgi:hypothetical protein
MTQWSKLNSLKGKQMKPAANVVPQALSLREKENHEFERLQRRAYLRSKGLNPNQPFQLELLFSNALHDSKRFIPNDYARSSLFTARNKRTPRRTLQHEKIFHLHEGIGISILYTGIELRAEDDEVIWLQILYYAKKVPLGEPFEFSIKDLVNNVGWAKNGRYYDKARESISRLKANEVMVLNEKAYGASGAISLISEYIAVNDGEGKPTRFRVWINPNLIVLFAGNTFTNHSWNTYLRLSPVARRLADYLESHQHPYPLHLEKFRRMCNSDDTNLKSWRQTVKKACAEIEATQQIAKRVFLAPDGNLYCVRD